jgi:hypothetical protein
MPLSARVDCVDDPPIVGLPQIEVPPPWLDARPPVANLADIAGVAAAVSLCPATGNRNVAAFESERLLLELTERPGKRLHINIRPHGVRRVDIKRAEGLLITIQRHRDGARVVCEAGARSWSGGRNGN